MNFLIWKSCIYKDFIDLKINDFSAPVSILRIIQLLYSFNFDPIQRKHFQT